MLYFLDLACGSIWCYRIKSSVFLVLFLEGFIKITDHPPTDHRPTNPPTTNQPTHRPLTTYPPTHQALTHRPTNWLSSIYVKIETRFEKLKLS